MRKHREIQVDHLHLDPQRPARQSSEPYLRRAVRQLCHGHLVWPSAACLVASEREVHGDCWFVRRDASDCATHDRGNEQPGDRNVSADPPPCHQDVWTLLIASRTFSAETPCSLTSRF